MESSIEIVQDKKVKKWIRYPIVFFLALFIIAVLITIMYVGIMFLMDEEINIKLAGVLFIIFDIILIIYAIKKVSKIIKDDSLIKRLNIIMFLIASVGIVTLVNIFMNK